MAQFETWLKADLKKPVQVTPLRGVVFSRDHEANKIGVEVLDGGQPAALSGAVAGYVIRDDGQTVTVTQSTGLQGNRAWVVLPQEAYATPGRVSIVIKLLSGGAETTLAACVGTVYRSATDSAIAPTGTPIPDLAQLNAAIQAANSAAASAGQFAAGCIAAAYDYNTDYAVGDYVTYNGRLYRCITAEAGMIRPEHGAVMNSDYWTPVTVTDEMETLAQGDAAGPYIAGEYVQDGGYAAGDYAAYHGRLYRCIREEGLIVADDGETLDSNYWVPVTVGAELARIGARAEGAYGEARMAGSNSVQALMDLVRLSEMTAPQFSSETAYHAGDYVRYNSRLYRCAQNTAAGAFSADSWTQVTVGAELASILSRLNALENPNTPPERPPLDPPAANTAAYGAATFGSAVFS